MNPHEARLSLFNVLTDFFMEMSSDGEEMTEQERSEFEGSFSELVDIMFDLLRLEITNVEEVEDGYTVTAEMFVT